VVLESADLQTFKFATDLGYNPRVMTTPNAGGTCNPTFATEFDEDYAAPGYVVQDPTLPAGNLVMLFEAENHCVNGVYNGGTGYASTGFARSSDNGKTWPAPQNGLTGGPNRYPVLQSLTASAEPIDKSLDGNSYLYATYQHPEWRNRSPAWRGESSVRTRLVLRSGTPAPSASRRFLRRPSGAELAVFRRRYRALSFDVCLFEWPAHRADGDLV